MSRIQLGELHCFQAIILPFYSHSNLAFGLIGRCLPLPFYTDVTYEEYVVKYILAPLNMTNTALDITDAR